ncbi:hypothetical protein FS819_029010 (plasmid) [Allorhizobium sp. Av2]|nr:hypothetical protein [Allorhizobium sp. Av2]
MIFLIKAIAVCTFIYGTGFGGAAEGLPEKLHSGLAGDAIWLFLPRFLPFGIASVIFWCLAEFYKSRQLDRASRSEIETGHDGPAR